MEINVQTVARAEMVWSVFLRTLTLTSIFYLAAQFYLGVLCLLGMLLIFGIDSSFILTSADLVTFGSVEGLGSAMFILGGAGSLLCGMLTFIVSLTIFYFSGMQPFRGLSVLILAICTVGLLVPILNIFPIMWLWNWYVAWANLKN